MSQRISISRFLLATSLWAVSSQASATYTSQIQTLASTSSCAKTSWKSRGTAPSGYTSGMALSFARSLCRLRMSSTASYPARIMSSADSHNARKDSLTYYHSTLAAQRMTTNVAGADTLRTTYTLAIGLGMRESSGEYCTGWDTSAGSSRPSSEAEAGLFQASYNSMGATSELRQLYNEYRADPSRCFLSTFKKGVSCASQSILGTGSGATYQSFAKSCPAFAAEYAVTLLRVLRAHFGPINRLEAEVKPACNSMFSQVQNLVDSDPQSVCEEVF